MTSEQFSCSGGTEECQEVLNPIPKQGTMPIFKLKCGNGNRVVFHNRGSAPQDAGSFNKAGANFLKRGRLSILWPNAYLLDVPQSLKSAVKDLVSHGRERFASEKARPLFRP